MPKFEKGHIKYGGRKKGSKNKHTIAKDWALGTYQQIVLREMEHLQDAQFKLATGESIVLAKSWIYPPKNKKEKNRKWVRVKNRRKIENLWNNYKEGEDYLIIWTKDPNVTALNDIFNRVFGKPREQIDLYKTSEELKMIAKRTQKIVDMEKEK